MEFRLEGAVFGELDEAGGEGCRGGVGSCDDDELRVGFELGAGEGGAGFGVGGDEVREDVMAGGAAGETLEEEGVGGAEEGADGGRGGEVV